MTSLYNPTHNDNKLTMVHAVTRTLGSLLNGVANATQKCMDNPGCIQTGGGFGLTDVDTFGYNTIVYIERTLILIVKIIGVFSNTIAPVLEEAIFGDLANKPWAEVAPQITHIINEKKDFLDKMSRDPAVQEALKEWAEAYATIGIQMTEAIKPSLNMIIDEAMVTLSDAGTRAGTGVINTSMNVIEGVIGEIPVAGGIIAIVLALSRGVNQAFVAAAPTLQFGLEAAGTGYTTANKVIGIVQDGKERLDSAAKSITALTDKFKNVGTLGTNTLENVRNIGKQVGENVIGNAQRAVQGAVQEAVQEAVQGTVQGAVQGAVQKALPKANFIRDATTAQTGGAARKKIKGKINRTTQRIKKTLHRFNNRRLKTRRR